MILIAFFLAKELILKEATKVSPAPHVKEKEEVQGTEPPSGLFASYQKKTQKKDFASTPHMQLTQFEVDKTASTSGH